MKGNKVVAPAWDDFYIHPRVVKPIRKKFLSKRQRCNICGKNFRVKSQYERFCKHCKSEDELYRFHDDAIRWHLLS